MNNGAVNFDRPEWLQSDAVEFRKFLGTASGMKFRNLLNFDEQAHNRGAVVVGTGNHAYLSGFAAGFGARSRSLMELSVDVRPQLDTASKPDGAEAFADRNAP